MTPPRVCYLGAYDPNYPRNRVIRRGLALHGVDVIECRAPRTENTMQRARQILQNFRRVAAQCDVILLSEFGQPLIGVAAWLALRYRKRLIVDAFTSLYDSAVDDRGTAKPLSARALRYWLLDFLAMRLSSVALVDTPQHADYFAKRYGVDSAKIHSVPVGAPQEWFRPVEHPNPRSDILVQFYGTYIPLHGIETILRAAARLPSLRFELIGRGQTYYEMRALAVELALQNVTFCDTVPPAELPAMVARAAISLGIFGETGKAARVVPNKVYQCMALGNPVITADTPAIRAAFTPGEHLLAVPAGDADTLAAAIEALAADPARRAELGAAGRARMESAFNEAAIGARLMEVLW